MIEVKVNGIGGSIGSDLDTIATFRVIRWKDGVNAAPENMSNVENDAHGLTQANWTNEVETTLTVIAHATVDSEYRYGVLVTPADIGSVTVAHFFNAVATGTNDRVTGR